MRHLLPVLIPPGVEAESGEVVSKPGLTGTCGAAGGGGPNAKPRPDEATPPGQARRVALTPKNKERT